MGMGGWCYKKNNVDSKRKKIKKIIKLEMNARYKGKNECKEKENENGLGACVYIDKNKACISCSRTQGEKWNEGSMRRASRVDACSHFETNVDPGTKKTMRKKKKL